MSAINIQKKLDKAHKKIGKILGYTYGIYRPLFNNDVLDHANLITYSRCSFTLNDSFTSTTTWGVPIWTVYGDAERFNEGDFLWSETQNRTFFILSRKPHLPVLAVEAPARFDIQQVDYDSAYGFAPTASTYIARNVPGFITMGASGFGGGVPGRNNATSAMRNIQVITSLPSPQNLISTTITDKNGFRGDIINYENSAIGAAVRLTAQEFERS